MPESEELPGSRRLLLAAVFLVAVAGLVYELLAASLSTYLLGASVTVFSLVIGLFLSAMGLGAWLSGRLVSGLMRRFVEAQVALALVGGLLCPLLLSAFALSEEAYPLWAALALVLVGALVGVEIPLLLRILERRAELRVAAAEVLAMDYAGALLASVLFPLALLPGLGLIRSGAALGLINLGVAAVCARLIPREERRSGLSASVAALALLLTTLLATGAGLSRWIEDQLYDDQIVLAESTPYQRIVITRWRQDWRLFSDGHLQFSSQDEHRYHELLVHPLLAALERPRRVLILGGGDGLAAREVLRHPSVAQVDLVDLDPRITEIFREEPRLAALNQGSLSDPRVRVHSEDALRFLEGRAERWDAIIADLPDPHDPALARLYSEQAYQLMRRSLQDRGGMVTQATSPFYAPEAFGCIHDTVREAFSGEPGARQIWPLHVFVPSFGEWGFVLALPEGRSPTAPQLPGLRHLDAGALDAALHFPPDIALRTGGVNRLSEPRLDRLYRKGWSEWNSR